MEAFTSVLSMLGMLALIIAIFVGTYYATRFLANGYLRTGYAGKQIHLLDHAQIGKDQSLVLVRAADKVYLIASGPAGAVKIDEMDPSLFPQQDETSPAAPGQPSFMQVLSDAIHHQKPGGSAKGDLE